MTQEDKELLLKDLCARLPYKCKCKASKKITHWHKLTLSTGIIDKIIDEYYDEIKPYLRPLSSMTEEESGELSNIISEWFDKELFYLTEESFLEYALSRINYSISPLLFDWLNAHHFDYRSLIGRGLAIEVTKDNNPYKE